MRRSKSSAPLSREVNERVSSVFRASTCAGKDMAGRSWVRRGSRWYEALLGLGESGGKGWGWPLRRVLIDVS